MPLPTADVSQYALPRSARRLVTFTYIRRGRYESFFSPASVTKSPSRVRRKVSSTSAWYIFARTNNFYIRNMLEDKEETTVAFQAASPSLVDGSSSSLEGSLLAFRSKCRSHRRSGSRLGGLDEGRSGELA